MGRRTSLTVVEAVERIRTERVLLPGIQRSFVWDQKKITTLFDSLMRNFPIGTLLVWKTRPSENPKLRFHRLICDYKAADGSLSTAHPSKTANVGAILDGQQRLTALNIGLRGSYTASGYLRRSLHLDLDSEDLEAGSEVNAYKFRFLAENEVTDSWYRVSQAVGLHDDAASLRAALDAASIPASPLRLRTLRTLTRIVNQAKVVHFEEEVGSLDRVLNIFSRTNSGGTKLTFAELLISTATARWKELDAKTEIGRLREAMNRASPEGFRFTEDRIVKAGLVLLDVKEPRFNVEVFVHLGIDAKLESNWVRFANAMVTAARVLASFGLSGQSLPSQNVVIPIAYYLYRRGLPETFATAHTHEKDRQLIRAFVARTLMQSNYWTGAVDNVLTESRSAIQSAIRRDPKSRFPLKAIEQALEPTTKPISVDEAHIQTLATLPYRDGRTIVLLRLLFPHMVSGPISSRLDKDHVFPRAKLASDNAMRVIPAEDWRFVRELSEIVAEPSASPCRGQPRWQVRRVAQDLVEQSLRVGEEAVRLAGSQEPSGLPCRLPDLLGETGGEVEGPDS